jgi:hypothetical protein
MKRPRHVIPNFLHKPHRVLLSQICNPLSRASESNRVAAEVVDAVPGAEERISEDSERACDMLLAMVQFNFSTQSPPWHENFEVWILRSDAEVRLI